MQKILNKIFSNVTVVVLLAVILLAMLMCSKKGESSVQTIIKIDTIYNVSVDTVIKVVTHNNTIRVYSDAPADGVLTTIDTTFFQSASFGDSIIEGTLKQLVSIKDTNLYLDSIVLDYKVDIPHVYIDRVHHINKDVTHYVDPKQILVGGGIGASANNFSIPLYVGYRNAENNFLLSYDVINGTVGASYLRGFNINKKKLLTPF